MRITSFLTSVATAALLTTAGLAQTTTDDAPAVASVAPEVAIIEPRFTSKADMTVGDVIGMFTYDPDGRRIGEIDYVVMQPDGLSAVIGIGGFLGLGEYTVAMQFEKFDLRPDGLGFMLDATKDALKAVPEFDESGAESLPAETSIASVMDATAPVGGMPDAAPVEGVDCVDAQGNAMADCTAPEGSAMPSN